VASAVAGRICAPTKFDEVGARKRVSIPERAETTNGASDADIIDGFPERLKARALLLPADNLNTDGIYAGTWTYKDDMTPEQMAAVCFENYDEHWGEVYRDGDVIVSGRNFGTGSSREQAATALKYRGVPCVVAASFSETYKRNAFNNGFLCLDCPELVDHLTASLAPQRGPSASAGCPLTIPGPNLEIDFRASVIRCDGREFAFPPLSTVAQELVVAGGAEAIARASLI